MQVLGRVKLPKSVDVADLYLRCDQGAALDYQSGKQEILLSQGGTISSNSYFNSFYEQFYAKYTNLEYVYYLLKLEGDFQVTLYREVYQGQRELLLSKQFTGCQLAVPTKVDLPNLTEAEHPGRIYFELTCLSEHGLFKEGIIATEQAKAREVSLGIVTCTFKKEAYVKNTVDAILQDDLLQNKALKVFVVDNGRTLTAEDFTDSRVQLIANRNVGGSGGFTRGLVEALQEDSYTHFLLMDDDIELDSEAVCRLFSLYEYAKTDVAVAGSMLDLLKKNVLYEAGALYGVRPDNTEAGPFSVTPLKHNLELQNPISLNQLLQEEDIDYGGFWFFAFSKELVQSIGLPMPYFIKIDDMEFGLRIKECCESKIVAFPSIAVWHEPFYAKYPVWDNYYHFRNSLITDAIHESLEYISAVKQTTQGVILYLLLFEYNCAEMVIKAFEDYLEGPDFIKNNDPERLHSNIVKYCKNYKSQHVEQLDLLPERYQQKSKPGVLRKIISLLTLNGHLLPNFLLSKDDAVIWQGPSYSGQRSTVFARKKVSIFREGSSCLYQNELDKRVGIILLARWFRVAISSVMKWSIISTAWRTAAKEMTSTLFWQQYLRKPEELKEPTL